MTGPVPGRQARPGSEPGLAAPPRAASPVTLVLARPAQRPGAGPARVLEDRSRGRLGRPDEIAAVVAFLASDAAGWVTAQNIRVNGGAA